MSTIYYRGHKARIFDLRRCETLRKHEMTKFAAVSLVKKRDQILGIQHLEVMVGPFVIERILPHELHEANWINGNTIDIHYFHFEFKNNEDAKWIWSAYNLAYDYDNSLDVDIMTKEFACSLKIMDHPTIGLGNPNSDSEEDDNNNEEKANRKLRAILLKKRLASQSEINKSRPAIGFASSDSDSSSECSSLIEVSKCPFGSYSDSDSEEEDKEGSKK